MGIDRVEHVAGVDLKPAHRAPRAIALHHPQPGTGRSSERQRRLAAHGRLQVKHHGQVHEHHMVGGDVPVMHHHRIGQVDGLRLHHLTRRVGAVIGEIRCAGQLIAEEQQLPGQRTGAGMGGHRPRHRTGKIMRAYGIELAIDRPGRVRLLQGQPLTGMGDNIGVGR